MQQRQCKVRRDIERASQAEHLEVGEPAERRPEAGVEVELVDKLEEAHRGDEEGEVCRVEAEAAGSVRPAKRSAT